MIRPSLTSAAGFSEIESSHSTGISAKTRTSTIAIVHSVTSFGVRLISPSRPAFFDADAEHLDEDRRDQDDDHEEQHRDRRAEAEVEPVDQLVEAEDRD